MLLLFTASLFVQEADLKLLQVKFPKKHKKLDRHEPAGVQEEKEVPNFIYYLLPGSLNEYTA